MDEEWRERDERGLTPESIQHLVRGKFNCAIIMMMYLTPRVELPVQVRSGFCRKGYHALGYLHPGLRFAAPNVIRPFLTSL
jgi:hypothetical protein